jgi:hypothetical protein
MTARPGALSTPRLPRAHALLIRFLGDGLRAAPRPERPVNLSPSGFAEQGVKAHASRTNAPFEHTLIPRFCPPPFSPHRAVYPLDVPNFIVKRNASALHFLEKLVVLDKFRCLGF